MTTQPTKTMIAIPNPRPERDYRVRIETPEFTCLCPQTGQPDFADVEIEYRPHRKIVELKSLKLYLWSFRNEGHYHEAVTNLILEALVTLLRPREVRVTLRFKVRGGITTTVVAEFPDPGAKRRGPRAGRRN